MNGVTLFEMWVLYGYKVVFFQLSNYFTSEQDKITFNDSLFPTCLLLFSSHYILMLTSAAFKGAFKNYVDKKEGGSAKSPRLST